MKAPQLKAESSVDEEDSFDGFSAPPPKRRNTLTWMAAALFPKTKKNTDKESHVSGNNSQSGALSLINLENSQGTDVGNQSTTSRGLAKKLTLNSDSVSLATTSFITQATPRNAKKAKTLKKKSRKIKKTTSKKKKRTGKGFAAEFSKIDMDSIVRQEKTEDESIHLARMDLNGSQELRGHLLRMTDDSSTDRFDIQERFQRGILSERDTIQIIGTLKDLWKGQFRDDDDDTVLTESEGDVKSTAAEKDL